MTPDTRSPETIETPSGIEVSEGDIIRVTGGRGLPDDVGAETIACISNITVQEPFIEEGDELVMLYLQTGDGRFSVSLDALSFDVISDMIPPDGVVTDDVVDELRERIDESFTFTVSLTPDDVFSHLNADRPADWEINGDVKGITEGKIVVDTLDGYQTAREDVWLEHYGGDEIVDVYIEDERFVAELFRFQRFKQCIVEWVRDELPTGLYVTDDGYLTGDDVWIKLFCQFNSDKEIPLPSTGDRHRFTDDD